MSWATLLGMPWYGMRRSVRWVWLLVSAAFWLGAAACVQFANHRWPGGWLGASLVLALWLVIAGMLLGTLLLPALEARHLRLPRLERAAPLSLGLNCLLALAVTAAPLAVPSGHPAPVIEMLLIGLAAGLLYVLLPALWMIPAFLCIPLLQSLSEELHWRFIMPLDARFLDVCVAFVALAACVGTWSWRRVLRSADRQLGWDVRPIAVSFRSGAQLWSFPGIRSGVDPATLAARQAPRWLERQAELRGTGPRDIPRSLQVLLGGPYLPVSGRTLVQGILLIALLLGFMAVAFLPLWSRHGWRWSDVGPVLRFAVTFVAAMVVMVGSLTRSMHLAQRWSRPSGELALMPLLPQLGTMPQQTSHLLSVVFTRMRAWQVPLILAALTIEWVSWHDPIHTFVLLVVLGMAAAAEVTIVYCTLGRRRIRPWALWTLALIGLVCFMMGLMVVQSRDLPLGGPLFGLLGGCAFCYAALGTFAALGKRALRRQPHPYLAVD